MPGGEKLPDAAMDRRALAVLRSLEQAARQYPANRGRIDAEPVRRRKVVLGRGVEQCGALQTANQLKRAHTSCCVEQLGCGRVVRIRNLMLTIRFADELVAGQLEGSHPGFRQGSTRNRVRQHFQVLRVCKQ